MAHISSAMNLGESKRKMVRKIDTGIPEAVILTRIEGGAREIGF